MCRYDCRGSLRISSINGSTDGQRKVSISVQHGEAHTPYYDVALPEEAAAIIRTEIEHTTPVAMVERVQRLFPQVTAKQIHTAWYKISETQWKRDSSQLTSARLLLADYSDDVDILDVHVPDGVEILAFILKKILEPLQKQIVEAGIDATCKCAPQS